MARPKRLDLDISHPAVDVSRMALTVMYGHKCMAAPVTCPHCNAERMYPLSTLRQQMKRPNFNGQCRPCGHKASREGTFRTIRQKKTPPRVVTTGYVVLTSGAVSDDDLPLFRSMQNASGSVFEHRLAMAKVLGRPLLPNELVDHMDGVKTNNSPENLRVYLRGQQQAGSHCGYGTYYDEWQRAEATIRALSGPL
jgi:hypothetical protein